MVNFKDLLDFAEWLYDMDALKLNNQMPPFETPKMMVEFYNKTMGANADNANNERVVCFKCGKPTEHDGEGNWCFECQKYTPF